ncbi:MAG: hypothetical protein AMQ22_02286 [Candidatus Methanofastidiosum methylothiophilum]|uniref:Damage-control phosphatase ARMT1-like metal-binding domain-containing protein n=1 Tax=Candidatus Methanofastidiosum methylothiophilum TaxID=1705564 RepID=A0A150IIV1_9EURY|nr:MAG: hypothetical protein AMQ22_02286 [Candidatus Methanofastidiosum methylthiophilus]
MKTYLDCIPCIIRQALDAARLSTNDEKTQRIVLEQAMSFLIDFIQSDSLDNSLPPPHIARHIYRIVKEITECEDPYHEIKVRYNQIVLKMYSELKNRVENSSDPLLTEIRFAIAGNIIDFGDNGGKFDLEATLKEALTLEFAVCDYDVFCDSLKAAKTLLYLGDNAGEIVSDKILIEEILKKYKLKVYYAVKIEPVINDATKEDAMQVKMNDVTEVIDSGSDAPGTILNLCSEKFLKIYNNADIIISKGQGNYETLSEENKKDIFFLLKTKCALIARRLGVKIGDMVLNAKLKEMN